MDNMFKGIDSLMSSVEMISANDTKILSMAFIFGNCENLKSFSINDFNNEEIKF